MLYMRWIEFDALHSVELVSKSKEKPEEEKSYEELRKRAIQIYSGLARPEVTKVEAYIATVDIKFSDNSKTYTYFVDTLLVGCSKIKIETISYQNGKHVVTQEPPRIVQIVGSKYRTRKELEALAQSQGFSFTQFKVIHGAAIK